MNTLRFVIGWLRGLNRGYKFAVLLVAAWAPFMFPENPLCTGVLMGLGTALFFIATGSKPVVGKVEPKALREKPDVEP
jgi:hypothetical protein